MLLRFADQLSGGKDGLSQDDAYGIVKLLASLYRYHSETNVSASKFVTEFILAAKEEVRNLPGLDQPDWTAIRRTVVNALAADQPASP